MPDPHAALQPGLDRGLSQEGEGLELGEHYVVIRRVAQGGLEVDITGLSLREAAAVYNWLRENQPPVRVTSNGKVLGRYRKRMKR